MATLRLLLVRIEETDRLIDEIVYKLRGLTDEDYLNLFLGALSRRQQPIIHPHTYPAGGKKFK